jgi:hypothetical protein
VARWAASWVCGISVGRLFHEAGGALRRSAEQQSGGAVGGVGDRRMNMVRAQSQHGSEIW